MDFELNASITVIVKSFVASIIDFVSLAYACNMHFLKLLFTLVQKQIACH